jgi:hypothetical protein
MVAGVNFHQWVWSWYQLVAKFFKKLSLPAQTLLLLSLLLLLAEPEDL